MHRLILGKIWCPLLTELDSKPSQTSNMELFSKIVNVILLHYIPLAKSIMDTEHTKMLDQWTSSRLIRKIPECLKDESLS